jgi:hypothetical protein
MNFMGRWPFAITMSVAGTVGVALGCLYLSVPLGRSAFDCVVVFALLYISSRTKLKGFAIPANATFNEYIAAKKAKNARRT